MTRFKKTTYWIWGLSFVVVLLIGGFVAWQSVYKSTGKSLSSNVEIGGPFTLIDHNGAPITQQALEGHPSIVFFGFTHCPEVCPTTLYEISTWFEALGDEGKFLRAFFISIDPERDTPEAMKNYVTHFSDRITGITGDPAEIFKLAKSWFVYWKKIPDEDGDGDYNVDHTASVFLVDPQGRFKGTIAYGESKKTAVEKLRRLAKSNLNLN